jgi:hypothetical protein
MLCVYFRSNCDCDERFYECLKKANTLISTKIGLTYFNVLRPKCFRKDYPVSGCEKYEGWVEQYLLKQWFSTISTKLAKAVTPLSYILGCSFRISTLSDVSRDSPRYLHLNAGIIQYIKLRPRPLPFTYRPFPYSESSSHFILYCLSCWQRNYIGTSYKLTKLSWFADRYKSSTFLLAADNHCTVQIRVY